MGLFDFLSSREKKVSNQKLEANISKLCEELTTGIIQLSEKAKQLNELKDKYNQFQSEAQTTDASNETVATKPVEEKSFLSNLFGSSEDKVTPDSPATQPIPDNNLQTSEDNINPDMLSAASTASPEQAQISSIDQPLKDFSQADTPQGSLPLPDYKSISSSSVGSDAMQPAAVPDATQQLPPPPPPPQLDYNNISSNPFGSDAMQPVPAPAATPDAAAAAAPSPSFNEALQNPTMPLAQLPPPPTLQPPPPPVAQNPIESSAISTGGKNRKKSKRSKKTIRKSDKTLNKVTKKQKINNADSSDSGDSKAKAQGLAQALLQSQGQS
jgi:hypothetical protein